MKVRIAALTGAVLIATVTAITTAAPASAGADITCSGWPQNDNWSGTAYAVSGKTSPLRSGPYGACRSLATIAGGKQISIDCYVQPPEYGNVWYHAATGTAGKGTEGWIFEDNVTDLPLWVEPCVG